MTNPKSPKPNITPSGTNPIEKAIGDRAKTTKGTPKIVDKEEFQKLAETQDVPSHQEMLSLEELNRETEERLQDQYPEERPQTGTIPQESVTALQESTTLPVSKPDPQPVTKTSSPESPPQKIDEIDEYQDAEKRVDMGTLAKHIKDPSNNECPDCKVCVHPKTTPAEDIELTNLKKYILEDGFVLNTVAFHIVSLCAEPLTTPSTTMWDFKDRASIPDMVLALLNQPGYLEGIWPSLRIVMSSNKGNAAWCAGIATTIAFFDVVRTLPALKELG